MIAGLGVKRGLHHTCVFISGHMEARIQSTMQIRPNHEIQVGNGNIN